MRYLCLAYEEEKKLNALSRSEWDALRNETLAYVEALRKSGHALGDLSMLQTRNTTFVLVSRAPLLKLEAYKTLRSWSWPWVSSYGSPFQL